MSFANLIEEEDPFENDSNFEDDSIISEASFEEDYTFPSTIEGISMDRTELEATAEFEGFNLSDYYNPDPFEVKEQYKPLNPATLFRKVFLDQVIGEISNSSRQYLGIMQLEARTKFNDRQLRLPQNERQVFALPLKLQIELTNEKIESLIGSFIIMGCNHRHSIKEYFEGIGVPEVSTRFSEAEWYNICRPYGWR